MAARENLNSRTGTRPLFVDLRSAAVLLREIEVAGNQRSVIRDRPRSVHDDVLSPAIKGVAVRIGERVRDVDVEFVRPRFIPVNARVGVPSRRPPGRFHLRVMKRPFLKIDCSAGIEHEAVGRVVRVGRVHPVDDALLHVVAVIAVRVLEEENVGTLRDDHPAPPEFEPGRILKVVRERRALVRTTVAVGVFKDQQLVVGGFGRLPMGIVMPRGDPQPAPRVEGHLHRIRQLGKLLFGGK